MRIKSTRNIGIDRIVSYTYLKFKFRLHWVLDQSKNMPMPRISEGGVSIYCLNIIQKMIASKNYSSLPADMKKKVIGVLGGMGPESTAIFYQALIKQSQHMYGAQYDQDYPEIFIYNLPIPDVVEGLKSPEKTAHALIKGAQKLASIGVDFIVMPCNTVHYFYPDMIKLISIPFVCIFLATAKKLKAEGIKRVGFLATETTIKYKSFGDDFERNGIELIYPNELEKKSLTHIIMNILAGKKLERDKLKLIEISNNMQKKGSEGVVLACTDLPILLNQTDLINLKIYDTVEILAEATIGFAIGKIGQEILE